MPRGVREEKKEKDTVMHHRDDAITDGFDDEDTDDVDYGTRSRRRKFVSARKKRQRKILLIISCVFLVLITAVLILLSPIFAIEEYEVQNLHFYTDEEIISVINKIEGENGLIAVFENTSFDDADALLDLRLPDIERMLIFNCPYLESVTVSFYFPNTIVVDAVERKPIFLTDYHNTYLYIDSKGVVLETFTAADCPDYPIVKGLEIEDFKIGCSIAENDNNKIFVAMKLCNTLASMGILENHIDIIDVSDYNDIWMFCAPALSIEFGDSDGLERKVSLLKGVFDAGYSGETEGTLDFNYGKNPVLKPPKTEISDEDVAGDDVPETEESDSELPDTEVPDAEQE